MLVKVVVFNFFWYLYNTATNFLRYVLLLSIIIRGTKDLVVCPWPSKQQIPFQSILCLLPLVPTPVFLRSFSTSVNHHVLGLPFSSFWFVLILMRCPSHMILMTFVSVISLSLVLILHIPFFWLAYRFSLSFHANIILK